MIFTGTTFSFNNAAVGRYHPHFAGDIEQLRVLGTNGTENKHELLEKDLFVSRRQPDPEAVLAKLATPGEPRVFSLVGVPQSGKSLFAFDLMQMLKARGNTVRDYDNSDVNCLDSKAMTALEKELSVADTAKPFFVFVDEPKVLPYLENAQDNGLSRRLAALVSRHPQVRLVGITEPAAFDNPFDESKQAQFDLLKQLFEPAGEISIPPPSHPEVLEMVNRGLIATGFAPMPEEIRKKFSDFGYRLDPRGMLREMFYLLRKDRTREDNVNQFEEIPIETWQQWFQNYKARVVRRLTPLS